MEIEVGEYGRTNKGKIFIFAWLENSDGKRYTNKVLLGNGKIFENKFYYFDDGEEIVKHSKNIIDLVEVGDYVNGYKVISVDYNVIDDKTECIELDLNNNYQYNFISARQIKTIITHEQFSSIEYKAGGEDE